MIILNSNCIWPKFKYKLQTQPKDFDLNAFLSVKGKYDIDVDLLVKELEENKLYYKGGINCEKFRNKSTTQE